MSIRVALKNRPSRLDVPLMIQAMKLIRTTHDMIHSLPEVRPDMRMRKIDNCFRVLHQIWDLHEKVENVWVQDMLFDIHSKLASYITNDLLSRY